MPQSMVLTRKKYRLREPFLQGAVNTHWWTPVDTDGIITVADGMLRFGVPIDTSTGAHALNPAAGSPAQITRRIGTTVRGNARASQTNKAGPYLILSIVNPLNNINQREIGLLFGASGKIERATSSALQTPISYTASVWYWFDIILAATGALLRISTDGVTFYPIWWEPSGSTSTLYVVPYTGSGAGDFDSISVRQGPAPIPRLAATPAQTVPVLGDELVVNGNMETGDPPGSWNSQYSSVLTAQADERTGGTGVQSLGIERGTLNTAAIQSVAVTMGNWYRGIAWRKNSDLVTGPAIRLLDSGGNDTGSYSNSTDWNLTPALFRCATAGSMTFTFMVQGAQGQAGRVDDASLQSTALPSALRLVGSLSDPCTTYTQPLAAVVDNTAFGTAALVDNAAAPTSGLFAHVRRSGATYTAVLNILTGGVWTLAVVSAAVTWAAGSLLQLVVARDPATPTQAKVGLYFGSTKIGTDQTITLANYGTALCAFDPSGLNAFGEVRGW